MKQVNKLLVGCCLTMAGFAAQAAELQVQLEGVKHDKGVVKVGFAFSTVGVVTSDMWAGRG